MYVSVCVCVCMHVCVQVGAQAWACSCVGSKKKKEFLRLLLAAEKFFLNTIPTITHLLF